MSDLIERQAAIDSMCELMRHWFGCDSKDEIREIKRELGKLLTIEPERLKGHWIPIDEDSDVYECDVCRTTYDTVCGTFDLPYFCPHCGADLRGEQE